MMGSGSPSEHTVAGARIAATSPRIVKWGTSFANALVNAAGLAPGEVPQMHSNRFRPICRNRTQAPLAPTIAEVAGVLRAHVRGRTAADASFQEREATL